MSFDSYIQEVLTPNKQFPIYNAYKNLSKEVFWFLPYENIVLISEKPTNIVFDEDQRLHNTKNAAIEFASGYNLYALNGVTIPDWVITTPKDKLDPKKILEISNVEQRLQAIKYVGLEKLLSQLKTKTIDRKDKYELILIDIEDKQCEFLKMSNPSTGEIHVEGIKPGIKTVNEALAWRMGLELFVNPKFSA